MMEHMQEGWVTIHGIPTHVSSWGGKITKKLKFSLTDELANNKSVILLLSGNPGIIKYYYTFLQTIYNQLAIPILAICHAGHEIPPKDNSVPTLLSNDNDLYNVSSQVAHKAEFIQQCIPPDKDIYIISHSFGAKITVELLKQEVFRKRIKKCYLLFPTLERIGDTPNGKSIKLYIKYLLPVIIFLSWVFTLLPSALRWWLIKLHFIITGKSNVDPNCIDATISLINPTVLKNVFNLASDEMDKIRELDKGVIEECIDKLRVYFGTSDGWAPLEYHHNLIQTVPKVDSVVLDNKYEHCFVFVTAEELAEHLSKQIKSDIL